MGQMIEIESGVGRPFDILAAFDRIDHPPRGRDGGQDGQAGYVGLKSGQTLKGKGFQLVPPGDRLVVLTPGGGGIGAPGSATVTRSPAIWPTGWCRRSGRRRCMGRGGAAVTGEADSPFFPRRSSFG